ncbi:uncharacterized protein LOC142341050 isoform X2 [Convolutriloba macropyga]|uniref:uncharacterized protein LOC142341050 isoform X2 n=1 Tax=Convolutriloba macropyga TaxID=536237 RepID=UPI003F51E6A6
MTSEKSDSEIVSACKELIRKFKAGEEPTQDDVEFVMSSNLLKQNMRCPDDGPVGEFADIMMAKLNWKQSQVSAAKCNAKQVLEIGVGAQAFAMEELLKIEGLKRLVGIEISDSFRQKIRAKFASQIQSSQLELYGTDSKDMKAIFRDDNSVDRILAVNVVYFLDPLEAYLKELYRVLKPQTGLIILSCKPIVEKTEDERRSVFANTDFAAIEAKCRRVGFAAENEKISLGENPLVDDIHLIKLMKPTL